MKKFARLSKLFGLVLSVALAIYVFQVGKVVYKVINICQEYPMMLDCGTKQ